ncbi:hypothetical protein [Xenorhabdus doucetiae]|nr:hypothetical protein [Xenorhabdus sp. 18]
MSQRSSQPKNPTESRPIDIIRTVKQSAMRSLAKPVASLWC